MHVCKARRGTWLQQEVSTCCSSWEASHGQGALVLFSKERRHCLQHCSGLLLLAPDLASSALQCEEGSREATLRDGQRWLDQAQGQLQNTQVALNDKEAECRELATCLEEAAEQAKFFEVGACSLKPTLSVADFLHTCILRRSLPVNTLRQAQSCSSSDCCGNFQSDIWHI